MRRHFGLLGYFLFHYLVTLVGSETVEVPCIKQQLWQLSHSLLLSSLERRTPPVNIFLTNFINLEIQKVKSENFDQN